MSPGFRFLLYRRLGMAVDQWRLIMLNPDYSAISVRFRHPYTIFDTVTKKVLLPAMAALLLPLLTSCSGKLPHAGKVQAREISFKAAGITHYGTLTMPRKAHKAGPGVLLLAGTPADRNWDYPSRPMRSGMQLARFLSARGYTVLRYDRMGSGRTEHPSNLQWGAYSEAALAAARFLAASTNTIADRIAWIAHSDAAVHALEAAKQLSPRTLVLLSPPGLPLGRALIRQIGRTMAHNKRSYEEIRVNTAYISNAFHAIVQGKPVPEAPQDPHLSRFLKEKVVKQFQAAGLKDYTRHWLSYDPGAAVARTRFPVLIITGSKDFQNPAAIHHPPLRRGLSREKKRVQFSVISNMDFVLKQQQRDLREMRGHEILISYSRPVPLHPQLLQVLEEWLGKKL